MDRFGHSELIECDKSDIVKRVSVTARILGPIFSHSSTILAREKAMIVNLEFIRAIVTAEEVLLSDLLCHEVLPFVDQLRRQLPQTNEGERDELPFEFQVLEIALQVVCTYLDSNVAELERDAYPALDELAVNVSTKNLEHVGSLESNLTRLLARVQKARDEIEHLLDDNEDMSQLYLTRKWVQNQQSEAILASNSIVVSSATLLENDVEDLEMLLEVGWNSQQDIICLCY